MRCRFDVKLNDYSLLSVEKVMETTIRRFGGRKFSAWANRRRDRDQDIRETATHRVERLVTEDATFHVKVETTTKDTVEMLVRIHSLPSTKKGNRYARVTAEGRDIHCQAVARFLQILHDVVAELGAVPDPMLEDHGKPDLVSRRDEQDIEEMLRDIA